MSGSRVVECAGHGDEKFFAACEMYRIPLIAYFYLFRLMLRIRGKS